MIKEVKIPSPGESITEVEIAEWLVEDGVYVEKNDEIAEIESDKATLELIAEESGVITIKAQAGEAIKVGSVACTIDTDAKAPEGTANVKDEVLVQETKPVESSKSKTPIKAVEPVTVNDSEYDKVKITPVASEVMKENNLSIEDVINGLRRISKDDVQQVIENKPKNKGPQAVEIPKGDFSREESRTKMSMLRRRLSERLVSVKNETAMLTTFNEIDMSFVMELRKKMQNQFIEKHGFKVGFMGFFTKAVSIAAQSFPMVNSQIDGEEIVSPSYVDVGIAVQTPKGLMVPNIRNAESKSVPQIELDIKNLAAKARDKKITMEELSGGTISITNGGVFGSLLSTPIINPPQSAILGMHNIVERPIAVNGEVKIRPMMYVALSYDHRIIDGKDSVGFLVKVKELIENPEKMVYDGKDPAELLLDL